MEFMCKSCGQVHPSSVLSETVKIKGVTYKTCKKAVMERKPGNIEAVNNAELVEDDDVEFVPGICSQCSSSELVATVGNKTLCPDHYYEWEIKKHRSIRSEDPKMAKFETRDEQYDYMVQFGERLQGRGE